VGSAAAVPRALGVCVVGLAAILLPRGASAFVSGGLVSCARAERGLFCAERGRPTRAVGMPPVRRTLGCSMLQDPTIIFNFLAGGVAGTVASVATQPFYVAKTKMQARGAPQRNGPCPDSEGAESNMGIMETMRTIVKQDGWAGLWVGSLPVLMFAFPESALQLGTHDWALSLFGVHAGGLPEEALPLAWQVGAASLAGIPSVLATNPMDMLAIQKIVEDEKCTGSARAGPPAGDGLSMDELYGGITTTWMRDVPFLGIYFPAFVCLSTWLSHLLASSGLPPDLSAILETILAGSLAGMFASALTTPADVINVAVKSHLLREAASAENIFCCDQGVPSRRCSEAQPASWMPACGGDTRHGPAGSEENYYPDKQTTSTNWLCVGQLPSAQDQRLMLTTSFARRGTPRTHKPVQGLTTQLRLVSQVATRIYADRGAPAFFSGVAARVSQVMPAQSLTICCYALIHWLADVVT
jgi:hypothetical protein